MAGTVHPGALRYWKERGVKVGKTYTVSSKFVKKFRAKLKKKKK